MKISVEDVDDGLPFAQVRNRDRAIALVRDYAHEHGVNYAYVFIMRWDYKIDVSKSGARAAFWMGRSRTRDI